MRLSYFVDGTNVDLTENVFICTNPPEEYIKANGVAPGSDYMSLFYVDGEPYTFTQIISDLAWGLGYCGMPHILKNHKNPAGKAQFCG